MAKYIFTHWKGSTARDRCWSRAFTLVEILLGIAVVAILGGTAVVTVSNIQESTRVSKLEADVATVNAAVSTYIVNGGTLPDSATPQEIVDQLKKSADSTTAPTLAGLRGAMVDRRLGVEMQSSGEAGSGQERAVWNATAKKFVIATSGSAGVKRFILNDASAATNPGTEARTPTVKADPGTWVWQYTDVSPTGPTGPNAGPATSAAPDGTDPTAPTALQLNPPTFSISGGSKPLINFDLSLTLSNPNPSGTSQIYYSLGGAGASLYTGSAITVTPGMSVSAYASTSDPDHWTTSSSVTNSYQAVPVVLSVSVNAPVSSVTYAQAGGAMASGTPQTPSPATVTLNSTSQIPTQYLNSSKFQVYYTTDGSSPLTSGTAGPLFSGVYASPSITFTPASWGSSSTLSIKAAARTLDASMFTSSSVASASIGITSTFLASPSIDPPSGQKAVDLPVSIALASGQSYPVGARIYYTTDGTDPGNSGGNPVRGTLYTGSFNSGSGTNNVVVVMARVYGPSGYGQWFTPSSASVATYSIITLVDGALVGSATLNGTFVGSLVYAMPTSGVMSNITFNSNARILNGNIYLPGTPTIRLSNGTTWSAANDSKFSSFIQGWEFDSNGTKTVQTTPRVLDENGSATPNNYSVSFNNSSLLEGKVIRRHDSPSFPTIAAPPAPDGSGSTSLNSAPSGPLSASQYSTITLNSAGVGDVRLNAGHYSNLTANNGTAFVLGDPDNPNVTQIYSFQSLTLNSSSDLKIVGKVIVTVAGSITINSGSVLGDSSHPEWLQLQFSSGNFTANSGSTMYGQLVVPTGSVTFNAGSVFTGSVTAQTLTINSSSIVFDLPPVIQN